ncbi:MAG: rubrerythrin [Deltaproteobacteria bacterium]|nr:rubrerythrin [Deltaproteobacteria bacterium]
MSPTPSIDFTKLTLCDALDLATIIEEEAKERYEEFAHQMELHHNPDAAAFFLFMLKIEALHEGRIAGRRRELFGDAPRNVRRELIFDVEAPEYHEVRSTMTHREALETALRAEKKAYAFFDAAMKHVADAEVRSLFSELREDEIEHAGLVEKELAKLTPDSKIKAEDVEDEPIAH